MFSGFQDLRRTGQTWDRQKQDGTNVRQDKLRTRTSVGQGQTQDRDKRGTKPRTQLFFKSAIFLSLRIFFKSLSLPYVLSHVCPVLCLSLSYVCPCPTYVLSYVYLFYVCLSHDCPIFPFSGTIQEIRWKFYLPIYLGGNTIYLFPALTLTVQLLAGSRFSRKNLKKAKLNWFLTFSYSFLSFFNRYSLITGQRIVGVLFVQ